MKRTRRRYLNRKGELNMKKFHRFLILVLMVFLGFGCGATAKPDDVVKEFFSAAQTFDMEKMVATIVPENTLAAQYTREMLGGEEFADYPEEVMGYLEQNASKITYEITSSQITGDQAVVTVAASYIDSYPLLEEIFSEYMTQAFAMAFSGQEITDEDYQILMADIFADKLETASDNFKDATLEIPCEMIDGKWYISDVDEDLLDVFLSGFILASATFESQINQ